MVVRVSRIVIAAACLVWLAGCETTSTSDNPFAKLVGASGKAAEASASDSDVTGSVITPTETPPDAPKLTPELLGADPNDDLSIGKKYFRQGS